MLAQHDTTNSWRRILSQYKYWDQHIIGGIQHFLSTFPGDDPLSFGRSDLDFQKAVLVHRRYNRVHLERILLEYNQWKIKYPVQTAQYLTVQFVDAVMAKLDGMRTEDFTSFASTLCPLLQTNISDSILPGTLRLMVEFMTTHAGRLGDATHSSYTFRSTLRGTYEIDALDSLVEDLFELVATEQVDCDTLRAVWDLIQVSV